MSHSKIITEWMNLCIFILKRVWFVLFDILQGKKTHVSSTHKMFLANKMDYRVNFHIFVLIFTGK